MGLKKERVSVGDELVPHFRTSVRPTYVVNYPATDDFI